MWVCGCVCAREQAITWNGEELGANFDVTPLAESTLVDDELKESAAKYHEELVELAVEQDEDVMMAYLDVRFSGFIRIFCVSRTVRRRRVLCLLSNGVGLHVCGRTREISF